MSESTCNAMIAELEHDKKALLDTISKSQDIIREHQQILETTKLELLELENGIQFLRKRYLKESPEITEENINKISSTPTLLDAGDVGVSQLELYDAVLLVVNNNAGKRMSARDVAEILKQGGYQTTAKTFDNFISIVGNTLRLLEKDGKIKREKLGARNVKYFSL